MSPGPEWQLRRFGTSFRIGNNTKENRGSDAWCDGKDRGGRTKGALDSGCGGKGRGVGQKGALDPRCGEDDEGGGQKGLWIPAAARMTGGRGGP